jgi:polyisoprenoid-binding protein YceI
MFAASLLAVSLSAADAPLAIDKAASHVDIAVKATVDSFVGKLTDYVPTIAVDRDTGAVTSSKVTFHFADVKTGNEKRDREMNEWQQSEKFPDGDFTLDSLTAVSPGKFTVHGRLTLHGSTHELTFPAAIIREGPSVTVDGEAVVDTRVFGLPVIRKFALLKVDPLVTVRFHLAGSLASP